MKHAFFLGICFFFLLTGKVRAENPLLFAYTIFADCEASASAGANILRRQKDQTKTCASERYEFFRHAVYRLCGLMQGQLKSNAKTEREQSLAVLNPVYSYLINQSAWCEGTDQMVLGEPLGQRNPCAAFGGGSVHVPTIEGNPVISNTSHSGSGTAAPLFGLIISRERTTDLRQRVSGQCRTVAASPTTQMRRTFTVLGEREIAMPEHNPAALTTQPQSLSHLAYLCCQLEIPAPNPGPGSSIPSGY